MTPCHTMAVGLLAGAGVLALVAVAPAPTATADVCANVGRRINVSGCF